MDTSAVRPGMSMEATAGVVIAVTRILKVISIHK